MEKTEYLNFDHARTPEQIEVMRKIKEDGVCPFCWEYFETYHPKPVLAKTDWWIMTENMSPYEGSRVHLIFVYRDHTQNPGDISAEGASDLFALVKKARADFDIPGGTFLMRFGDTAYTGGSVSHLHAQLISGGPYSEGAEKIKPRIGYKSK